MYARLAVLIVFGGRKSWVIPSSKWARLMGKGIKGARAVSADIHADVLDDLKDQLLVVFLKRLKAMGHSLEFPVTEIDDTGYDLLSFSIDPVTRNFHFQLSRKS